ncbi:restriction endonuclease subunit S [Aliarcobacter sp. ERUVET-8]|uniref:restriction endonuclease subunit S n=1 Tax=Aliarcobacter sp. ERUVET-8 TaxID=3429684 RepID=UPI003D6B10D7
MSNVPKLRFKEFSGEWEKKTIGDVSKIFGRIGYRGYTVEDIVQKGEGAIALSPGNFVNNRLNIESSTYISWFKYEESPEIMIENGDILFVKTGSTYGKTAFVTNLDENATINPQIVVLKEINMNNTLLSYIVSNTNIKKQVERIVVGGAIPTMSQKELAKMKFYLPSKEEQEKIASFLTSVDIKIEQLTKKEELLSSYKKGVMQKIFNQEIRFKADDGSEFCEWEEKKLEQVLTEPRKVAIENPNEMELLTVQLHCKGVKRSGNFPTVTRNGRPYYKRNKDELLIGRQNFHNGGIGIVNEETDGYICSNAITSLVAKKDSIQFLYLYLSRTDYYKKLDDLIGGTGQKEISKTELNKLELLIPCFEEQIKIANFLSSIDSKIEQVQKQLNLTKEFKKALLQQMFV